VAQLLQTLGDSDEACEVYRRLLSRGAHAEEDSDISTRRDAVAAAQQLDSAGQLASPQFDDIARLATLMMRNFPPHMKMFPWSDESDVAALASILARHGQSGIAADLLRKTISIRDSFGGAEPNTYETLRQIEAGGSSPT
jgi:hypothetical protein